MNLYDEYRIEEESARRKYLIPLLGVLLALIASGVFLILTGTSGVLPGKWLLLLTIGIILVLALSAILGCSRKISGRIISLILSVILIAGTVLGTLTLQKTNTAMEQVSSTKYKLTGMVTAVRADDPAAEIKEAANYRFGIQTGTDQNNTRLMVENVSQAVGQQIQTIEFPDITTAAQALLQGQCDALIYNEALALAITDQIEGYEDAVRVLYRYEIQTDLENAALSGQEGLPMAFNVYVSGIDVAGDISTVSRSDVNIIATVNRRSHNILLTTTPRDYFIPLPGVSGEARDKLTHAGIYGVDVSMAALGQLYISDIPYFVRINFTGLMNIVDIIGGVDAYSEYAFSTTRNGKTFTFTEGMNHMDGEAALAFSRERYSFQSGDNQRGKNQQAVLTALIQKALDPSVLPRAFDILEEVSNCVQTNFTPEEMTEFINGQLSSNARWKIESQQATGTGDTQITFSAPGQPLYVMWPDETSVAGIRLRIQEILSK